MFGFYLHLYIWWRGVKDSEFMLFNSLIHAIPAKWKHLAKRYCELIVHPISHRAGIGNNNLFYQVNKIKVRLAYKVLMSKKMHIIPSGPKKYSDNLNMNITDWEKIYLVPRLVSKDNRLREFQFKILHKYLATNKLLKPFKITENANFVTCKLKIYSWKTCTKF